FYFHQSFLIFAQLSGIIPVVAAAFTLMRFSRFNELVAMLAAGVPLLRIAMPIILASLVLNGLLLVDQELIIPAVADKLVRNPDELRATQRKAFHLRAMQADDNALLSAAKYIMPTSTEPAEMEKLDVIHLDERNRPVSHLRADRAVWNASLKQWELGNGVLVTGLLPDDRQTRQTPVDVYRSSINPDEIALHRYSDYVDLLATARIDELLERPKAYGAADLLRVKHFRFTQPIANFILLLLAIPCVLTREPGRLKAAATKTVVVAGLCMGAVFLAQQLASSNIFGPAWQARWPIMMAWIPIFIFAPAAVLMLDRVKT
ncbi:MAG: LptF/LptG family permease, partial [Tepidisphaeraceae bacterium]